MNDPRHLDDEQLTALQDGDGSADDRAHLDSCARCSERASALASVATLVAAPPPAPSDDDREAAVAAALAEAGRPAVPRRPAPRRRVPEWLLPAAAVVALLALVAAVVPRLGNGDDDDSAAGRTSAAESEDSGDAVRDGAGAGDDAAGSSAPPAEGDLGAVDDEAELARRVDQALLSEAAADETLAPPPATGSCETAFRAAGQALGPLRLRADLVWRGQPAEVLADGDRAVVVAAGGCATLATVDLP